MALKQLGSGWQVSTENVRIASAQAATGESADIAFVNSERKGVGVALYGTSGAISATVEILASVDGKAFALVATAQVSGTGAGATPAETALVPFENPYSHWKSNVTAISGTGANVDVDVVAVR